MAYQKHEDYTEVFDVQNIYNVAKHLVKISAEMKDYVGGIKSDTDYMVEKWLYESCTTMAAQLTLIAGYENTENSKLADVVTQLTDIASKLSTANSTLTTINAAVGQIANADTGIQTYLTMTTAGGFAYTMSQILTILNANYGTAGAGAVPSYINGILSTLGGTNTALANIKSSLDAIATAISAN